MFTADDVKQVSKISYPNGKIDVGMDRTGSLTYFGSPSAKARIAADLGGQIKGYTARKQVLWGSETAVDAEVREVERTMIVETGANNPEIGDNLTPHWAGRSN